MTKLQQDILKLAGENLTNPEVADRLQCSEDYVQRVRKKFGRVNPQGRPRAWDAVHLEVAEELLDDGASYRDVSETTGIPKTTLRGIFPGQGFTKEDTARLAAPLAKLSESFRWSLVRKRKD